MPTSNLCRGLQCPNRKVCRRFRLYLQAIADGTPHPASVAHCPDQKWFIRHQSPLS
jgi:hypothetical protein